MIRPEAPTEVRAPFEPLPKISVAARGSIAAEANRVNDRYLDEFLEEYAFCPYSRPGRKRGEVFRYVHYFDDADLEPVLELFTQIAADPRQVVAQVIFPAIEVEPKPWARFCHQLTALGHTRVEGGPFLAVAPLHPRLRFNDKNEATLVPLFRRTPDPTIQWVRLDGLASIYEGRGNDKIFVDIDAIPSLLEQPERTPLWDQIAQTNMAMARRLSIPTVEALLADIAEDARLSYERVLSEG